MPPTSKHRLAVALIFITPALWAVNYLVARSAPGVIEPHALDVALVECECAF